MCVTYQELLFGRIHEVKVQQKAFTTFLLCFCHTLVCISQDRAHMSETPCLPHSSSEEDECVTVILECLPTDVSVCLLGYCAVQSHRY